MALLLLTIFICLSAESIIADYPCETAKSIVEDIDLQKIRKTWNFVYINDKDLAGPNSCWTVEFDDTSDTDIETVISATSDSYKRRASILGNFQKKNGHFFNGTNPSLSDTSVLINVLATDYERYMIVHLCSKDYDGSTDIAFASWTPDDESLSAAKEALSKIGLDFNNFELFCPLSKAD